LISFLDGLSFSNPSHSFLLELVNFFLHSEEVLGAFLRKLGVGEADTFLGLGEPCEEESKGGDLEELFLGLLAVFVHCVSDNPEVDVRLVKEVVFLIVSVRVNHS
jgi:hypothetical protein